MLGTIGMIIFGAIFGYGCIHLFARLNDFIEEQRGPKKITGSTIRADGSKVEYRADGSKVEYAKHDKH